MLLLLPELDLRLSLPHGLLADGSQILIKALAALATSALQLYQSLPAPLEARHEGAIAFLLQDVFLRHATPVREGHSVVDAAPPALGRGFVTVVLAPCDLVGLPEDGAHVTWLRAAPSAIHFVITQVRQVKRALITSLCDNNC